MKRQVSKRGVYLILSWDLMYVCVIGFDILCVAQQAKDNRSTSEAIHVSFFQESFGYLCNVYNLLFAQFPGRDCFLPVLSVRHEDVFFFEKKATGHWPAAAAIQHEIWSQITSPKTQYTNLDKLRLDSVQAECCCSSKHQRRRGGLQPGLSLRKLILCLPSVQGKGQIKVRECTSVCSPMCLFVLQHKRIQKMDGQLSSSPLMLKAKQQDEQGEIPNAGDQERPPPSWRAPGLLSVILQSIRKGKEGWGLCSLLSLGLMPGASHWNPQSSKSCSNSSARIDSTSSG